MKKNKILSLALVVFASLFTLSCDEDPIVVEENEVPNGTLSMVYSVQVKQSSLSSGRTQGLAGVSVTVNQNGGIQTKTTDASGIVSFDNMRTGYVSVFVAAPEGFSSMNIQDEIYCYDCEYDNSDVEQVESDRLDVILPKQGATLTGKLFADVDFSGVIGTAETLPNTAVVIAKVSSDFEPNVYTTTVQNDGSFAFTNLPEGINVTLSLNFKKVDTTVTPTEEKTFQFSGATDGPYTLDVNNPLSLGNIDITHN